MNMKAVFFFFLCLLLAFSYGEVFNANFAVNGDNDAFSTVAMDFQPSLSASSQLVCTNTGVNFFTALEAHYSLANGATSSSLRSNARTADELIQSAGVNPSSPLQWIPQATYSSLRQRISEIQVSLTPQQWSNVWGGNVPQDITYSSTYLNAPNRRPPLRFDGSYSSSLHEFCNISAALVSIDGGGINRPLSSYYSGNQLSTSLAFNSPQSITLRADYSLRDCLLAAVSIPTQQSGRARSIDPMLNTQIARTISSQPVTVTIENPFACQQLPVSNLQISSPVVAGSPLTSSFTLTNPTAKAIRISSISFGQGSAFRDLQVLSPQLPVQLAPNAASNVQLRATAPDAEGTYALNLTVSYSTAAADCTGSIVSCTSNNTLSAQVTVEPHHGEQQLNCTLSPSLLGIEEGRSYPFNASCTNSTGATACPMLSWISNAGAMSPASSDRSSTLHVTNANGARWVAANGTSEDGTPFSCSATLVGSNPYSCILSPPSAQIIENRTYNFTAHCYEHEDLGVQCPTLNWSSDAGAMSPSRSRANSTLNVAHANGTYVKAEGASGLFAFSCNSTISSGQLLPSNLVAALSASKLNPNLGEDFIVTATVHNMGSEGVGSFGNMLNSTVLGLRSSQEFEIAQLGGRTSAQTPFTFTCPQTPTIMNFVFVADSGAGISEPIESDNIASISVLCGPVLTCLDYV